VAKHRKVTRKGRVTATLLSGVALATIPGIAFADPPNGWDPIIQCESGNRNVENSGSSTASGYLQFINSTWLALGGGEFAARAILATKAEQITVANRAFDRNGLRDWNASRSCWQGKVGGTTVEPVSVPTTSSGPVRYVSTQDSRTHVVAPGDTLSGIAGDNWLALYEANKEVIGSNPNLIFPGQTLRV
jgi:LysM repeat protein